MDALLSGLIVLVLILLFLGSGTWVFVSLLLVSTSGLILVLDFPPQRIDVILGKILFAAPAPGNGRPSRSSSGWGR